jgi:hypothetical protein
LHSKQGLVEWRVFDRSSLTDGDSGEKKQDGCKKRQHV